jgi:large subunit ribosomal protein L4
MASAPAIGGAKRSVELDASAFEARFNGPLVHESVRAELAARRRGTAATKTRGLVSGGGSKPWRQKGTGRARAGSSRSPVWTGGGTVFGPHPRSYTFKVNRKERRAALRSALSLHAQRGSLAVLDAGAFSAPSTRQAAALLAGWGQPRSTLVVVTAAERDAGLSFRNIERVAVLDVASVGVADIVGCASLLCSEAALTQLSARAAGSSRASEPSDTERESASAPTAAAPVVAPAQPKPRPAAKPKVPAQAKARPAAKPKAPTQTAEPQSKPKTARARKPASEA